MMKKSENGKLILKSIPTKKVEKDVITYLSKLFRKYPRDKISALVQKAPVTLSSRIPPEKGTLIAARLRELGAVAVFTTADLTLETVQTSQTAEPPQHADASPSTVKVPVPIILKPSKPSGIRQWALGLTAVLMLTGAALYGYQNYFGTEISEKTLLRPAKNLPKKSSPRTGNSDFKKLNPIAYKSPSVNQVAPQKMYAAFTYQYRLRPDMRFVLAFDMLIKRYGQLHNLDWDDRVFQAGEVLSDGEQIYIPLIKNSELLNGKVLKLPLTFADVKAGLADWLAVMDKNNKNQNAASGHGMKNKYSLLKAEQYINTADPRFVAVGLSLLEEMWQKGDRDMSFLKTVSRAYSMLLMFFNDDIMKFGDAFASEALSFLALAGHTEPSANLAREEFLLAMNMGYRVHAESLTANFTPDSKRIEDKILDAYMRQDMRRLHELSEKYPGILGLYLLARHYREIGLLEEAKNTASELLRRFPASYPSLVANIKSGPLNLIKILTEIYPSDVLKCVESKVAPETFEKMKPWSEQVKSYLKSVIASDISFAKFSKMLTNWSPFADDIGHRFIIDAGRVRQIYKALYVNAVYERFNLLFNRWGVIEKAQEYTAAFAHEDKNHPVIMLMQGLLQAEYGKPGEADKLFNRVINHAEANGRLIYMAFNALRDPLGKLRLLPLAAHQMDGRPADRLKMGWFMQKDIHNYDRAASYYESVLAQNPYQNWAYRYLASVRGSGAPLLEALERNPKNYQLLQEAGAYFAGKDDPQSLAQAARFYACAVTLAPSKVSLVRSQARVLRRQKKYNQALKVFNSWLKRYGGRGLPTTATKTHRAYIYLEMGQPDKALNTLGDDVESYQAGVMMNVARAFEDLGKTDKAWQQYQKALKRYPTVGHVIASAAGFLWRQGKPEQAAKMIANGRKSQNVFSRWYFEDFVESFENAADDAILTAVKFLKQYGATSGELSGLGWNLARNKRDEAAFGILSGLKGQRIMDILENTASVYKLLLEWKGKEQADEYLHANITAKQKGPLMMVLYKYGLFDAILATADAPDRYPPGYRDFMWLQMLIAWLASDKKEMAWEKKLTDHYLTPSSDYYNALGRYILDKLPLDDLLGMIRTNKQRCEFSYYIGMAARLKGDFTRATQWYHLCRETLLRNNGEFHWAENELFWWAHAGIDKRHRLVADDIATYHAKTSHNR